MEKTQDTTNLTNTVPTGLEAKAQTGEVEVRKGTGMLTRELFKLICDSFESKECLFNRNWDSDDSEELGRESFLQLKAKNKSIYADIRTDDRDPFVRDASCRPVIINAYTPLALEGAKVFAKAYKELTGQNAVIYQQFVPEDFVAKEQPKAELEEIVEEPTKPARNEVKFRGGMKPQPKPKESSGFMKGFYTATAGELAAKFLIAGLSVVGGYLLSECRQSHEQPPAQVREQDQTVRKIVEDVKKYNPNAID